MSRLFVAVFPPALALDHLGQVVDCLEVGHGDGAADRLTSREEWHLTLAFLGEIPADRSTDAAAAMTAAVSALAVSAAAISAVAMTAAVVTDAAGDDGATPGIAGSGPAVRLAGGGTFGDGDRQILWADVDGDVAALQRLAEALRLELRQAGFAIDEREFRPHLTITRPGATVDPELVDADLRRLKRYRGPEWAVESIKLVASEPVTTEAGRRSRYTVIAAADL